MARPHRRCRSSSFPSQGAITTAHVAQRFPSLINSRARKVRVRLNEAGFEPEEPRAEFMKFIPVALLGFAL
jgi:hypothetical protein